MTGGLKIEIKINEKHIERAAKKVLWFRLTPPNA